MGRVNGWKRQGLLGTDLIDFIESIPVRETRDYVSQIIRNHYWYSSRVIPLLARLKAPTGRVEWRSQRRVPGIWRTFRQDLL